jgi:uncharacterized protein (TIGR02646 family)
LVVIPVAPQPEPPDFDTLVRTPGSKWIAKSRLDPNQPVPAKTKIPAHWTKCLPALREAYGGFCAYVCVFVPKVVGAPSVEHFVPKSQHLNQAYEWNNYRFVCAKMNSRKRDFEDVLDPFTLEPESFELNLGNGGIAPHPRLNVVKRREAKKTIKRLKLDDTECRELRLGFIQAFRIQQITADYLKTQAPFIWLEMQRQGAL